MPAERPNTSEIATLQLGEKAPDRNRREKPAKEWTPEGFLKDKFKLHNGDPLIPYDPSGMKEKDPLVRIKRHLTYIESKYINPEEKSNVNFGDHNNSMAPKSLGNLRDDIFNDRIKRKEIGNRALEDIKSSLNSWTLYLFDPAQTYPTWFRYYAFRSVLELSPYDGGKFPKRSKDTAKPFPDIEREALAYVQQMIDTSHDKSLLEKLIAEQKNEDTPEQDLLTQEKVTAFAAKAFRDQYKEGIEKAGEIPQELLQKTEGEWKKYAQGSDTAPLWGSLQNKRTNWCTAGFSTAEEQLKYGDFYVYYTNNALGEPKIPRIAIRMEGDEIAEVRGRAGKDQDLESNMTDITEKKLEEFGSKADKFKKRVKDMKRMTQLEQKQITGQPFNREDLRRLYEIDDDIEGFGYEEDPRVNEFKSQREENLKEDLAIALDTTEDRISITEDEALSGNILYHFGNLDVYSVSEETKFPEGVIGIFSLDKVLASIPEGTKYTEKIGDRYILSVTSIPEGTKFPKRIRRSFFSRNLKSIPEGTELPEEVGEELYLKSVTSIAEGTILPKVGRNIYLPNLTSLRGLIFDENFSCTIELGNQIPMNEVEELSRKLPHCKINVKM